MKILNWINKRTFLINLYTGPTIRNYRFKVLIYFIIFLSPKAKCFIIFKFILGSIIKIFLFSKRNFFPFQLIEYHCLHPISKLNQMIIISQFQKCLKQYTTNNSYSFNIKLLLVKSLLITVIIFKNNFIFSEI